MYCFRISHAPPPFHRFFSLSTLSILPVKKIQIFALIAGKTFKITLKCYFNRLIFTTAINITDKLWRTDITGYRKSRHSFFRYAYRSFLSLYMKNISSIANIPPKITFCFKYFFICSYLPSSLLFSSKRTKSYSVIWIFSRHYITLAALGIPDLRNNFL